MYTNAIDIESDCVAIAITREVDIAVARQQTRRMARQIGLSHANQIALDIALTEIARNLVLYAECGHVKLQRVQNQERPGIQIMVQDQGPGIADIPQAMQDGFSTSGGLGSGLPGARRLVDEFDIQSESGTGTTVTITKWKQPAYD